MRWHKLAIHILVILSVFNFMPVLTAPMPVREACANMVGGDEDLIIVMGKQAEEEEVPRSWDQEVTQAPRTWSESGYLSTSLQLQPGSPLMSGDVSGVYQETINPIQPPPSVTGGTELPWYSSGDTRMRLLIPGRGRVQPVQPGTTSNIPPASSVRTKTNKWVPTTEVEAIQRPPYAFGGTELPWYSSSDTAQRLSIPGRGSFQQVQPGTMSKIPPASSVRTKPNKWVPTAEAEAIQRPPYAFGGTELPWYSSSDTAQRLSIPGRGRVQPVQPGTTSKIPPASSVRTKTNKWVPTTDAESSSGEMQMLAYASSGAEPPFYSSSSDDTELAFDKPGTTSKITPASPVGAYTWAATTEVPPALSVGAEMNSKLWPATEIGATSSSSGKIKPASPPPQITPVSSSRILPLSEQEGYLAQTPTKQQIPQSKGFSSFSKSFLSKSKSFLNKSKSISSNLASKSKNLFSKLVGKLRLWPRHCQWC